MSDLMLDVDQAGELKAAFRRGGYNNAEIKLLSEGDTLAKVRNVLRGLAEIKPVEHAIDLSADPFLPSGWSVEEHQKGKVAKLERRGDDLYLDGKKIEFWLSKPQKKDDVIGGNDLRKEVSKQPVLNANVLDYLHDHPQLIPDSWKVDEKGNTRYIFFWGTVCRGSDGDLFVRCLYWDGDRWGWRCLWLDYVFHCCRPAAVSAS